MKRELMQLIFKIAAMIWAFIPIVLLILPADFFDEGSSICLSVLILGQECPACGLTRAMMHLIHFDYQIAYSLNKLSFVLFPLIVYLWATTFIRIWKYRPKKKIA